MIFALSKNQGCYRLPPLKEISSRDLGRLERKIGLGNWVYSTGWLPPLKGIFVGSTNSLVQLGVGSTTHSVEVFLLHPIIILAHHSVVFHVSIFTSIRIPFCSHYWKCCFTLDGLSRIFLRSRVIDRKSVV